MSTPLLQAIPYFPDSSILFDSIADQPWSAFLDSGRPGSAQGRFDIIVTDPYITLSTIGSTTEISDRNGSHQSQDDPFSLVEKALGEVSSTVSQLPFVGGALGFFSYDMGRRLESLERKNPVEGALPDMAVGIYDWALVVDHELQQSWLVGQGRDPRTRLLWDSLVRQFSQIDGGEKERLFHVEESPHSNLTRAEYSNAFERIQRYITEGDCYQVNFSQRFSARCSGDLWYAYQQLRERNPAPFGAYIKNPAGEVLSCSPERFLQIVDGVVETKPIKGTRPRSGNTADDLVEQQALRGSLKDRAENLMIVDLLRNDLGKSCTPGTIHVPKLFDVESFTTVHHLVSTVRGELAEDKSALDLLRGAFPGGSITGAPKHRAMEIIEELEPCSRGVYCGSIGYVGFDGSMDTNIAIRTLVHAHGEVQFSAGGGIVADSDCDAEYQETFDKARAMLEFFSD